MSVQLHTIATTGTHCPKCANGSVFKKDVFKYWLFYIHTIYKCEMGQQYCDYEIKKFEK